MTYRCDLVSSTYNFELFLPKGYQKSILPSNSALLSSTFLTFCQKITSISHYWPKKSKKYSIIRHDLIEYISQIVPYYRIIEYCSDFLQQKHNKHLSKTHSLNPKAVNLGRFSLLMRGGIRNQRFESSLLPTHPSTHQHNS